MKLLKKAQIGGLQGFILSIVTVAVVLAVGLIVLSELQATQDDAITCAGTLTYRPAWKVCGNSTNNVSAPFPHSYNSTGTILVNL